MTDGPNVAAVQQHSIKSRKAVATNSSDTEQKLSGTINTATESNIRM